MLPTLHVIHTGLIDYQTAWDLQKSLIKQRSDGTIPDTLLIVEHPHTYTLGRAGSMDNLLLSEEQLAQQQIAFVPIDRGGDITYHGPGQLVAYPLLNLKERHHGEGRIKADFIAYIRALEEIIIQTLHVYGIASRREEGLTGVWVGPKERMAKIAAIGIKINARGISSHGIALNITTDLSYFDGIVPCGIDDKAVTSIEQQLGTDNTPSMAEVTDTFERIFSQVLDYQLTYQPLPESQ